MTTKLSKLYNCSLEKLNIFGELYWAKNEKNAISQFCASYDIKLKDYKNINCEEVPEALSKKELINIIK